MENKSGEISITVATPVFNGASTLRNTLDSVLKQTYRHIQYLVIDGNSNDGSQDIVMEYMRLYPEIVQFISEPDKGIYDAMNKAQLLATGDFLIFLGSDDILYDETVFENFVKQVTDRYLVYYGDVISSIGREIRYGSFTTEKLVLQNISHQAIFYPVHVYRTYNYNLKYKLFADWDYNLRLWAKDDCFRRINMIVSVYGENGASIHQDQVFLADRKSLVKKYLGSKYAKLVTMQKIKQKLIGSTDLRKIKGYFFPKIK